MSLSHDSPRFRELLKRWHHRFLPSYERELERAVGDCKTLIDLGCGYPSPIRSFSSRLHTVGVEAFASDLERSRAEGIHNDYREMDVLKVGDHFAKDSFECVLASDLIEHLTKEQGQELIEMMEALARRRVIIFTPNGYLPQTAHSGNPWQEHKSGWSVSEMREAGYRVIGINGWKPLRTERARIRFKPAFFWRLVSDLTQLFVRRRPESAFQILCVKDLARD